MAIDKEPGESGEVDDRVRIRLGSEKDLRTVEDYSFVSSVLQQPSAFSMTVSGAHGAASILRNYQPGPTSPCQLFIGSCKQFTGELDALNARGDANSTNVDLRGRDLMARVFDQDIVGDRSFHNATYEELYRAALDDCGVKGRIELSNAANRVLRAGVKIKKGQEPLTVDEVRQRAASNGKFRNVITAKMGETWFDFLERHMGKLGLFFWCDANGDFILSRPHGEQAPTYHFFRKRGAGRSLSNVKSFTFSNDTTHRFSQVVIFARNGGRKYGHNHTNGKYVDLEMSQLGFNRRRVYRDTSVANEEEATFYARKKIAEINRASWKLTYIISGHTAPLYNIPVERGVVVPDTVARVDDDELDIHENLYIESVEYKSPPRTTIITMMRPSDLVFGEAQAKTAEKKKEKTVRRMLSFVRNRDPISFERTTYSTNANNNQVLDPTSRGYGVSFVPLDGPDASRAK